MKLSALLLALFLSSSAILAQNEHTDVLTCLKLCLDDSDMEAAFMQEWGELRTLYLVKQNPSINRDNALVTDAIDRLNESDFYDLRYSVIPVTEVEARQLADDAAEFNTLNTVLQLEAQKATVQFSVNLVRYPRKWLVAVYALENIEGDWQIVKKSIQVQP
ncbi:MAG TPA: hypothetical protein PKA00_07195 [Saprospiraceae bacterium]|nr:hypothetical protein [Saprospiraceae bacterium]HMQ82675.1 hypothetical protein [Saprospiraceae bacterium]